jgi:tetratricopeptide (TPR) repeat protein
MKFLRGKTARILPIMFFATCTFCSSCSGDIATKQTTDARWKAAYDAGMAAVSAGDWQAAEKSLSDSIAVLGTREASEKRAKSSLALAQVFFAQHNFQGALVRSKEAMFYFESKWDPLKPASSLDESGMNFLNSSLLTARSFNALKQFDEALPLLERAHSLQKNLIVPVKYNHELTDALRVALAGTGRKKEARQLHDDIKFTESSLPQRDSTSIAGLGFSEAISAGRSAYQGGNFEAAEALFKQAISKAKSIGDETLEMAEASLNLGDLYLSRKRYAEARSILERALTIARKRLAKHDRRLKEYLKRLASVYANTSQWKKAAALDEEALELVFEDEYKLDKKTHRSRDLMDALIDIYKQDGRLGQAESMARRKLKLEEDGYGKTSKKAGMTLCQLGEVLALKKDDREAQECFERSLSILKNSHKTMARDLAETLGQYIKFLERRGDKKRAQAMRDELRSMNDALVDDLAGTGRR